MNWSKVRWLLILCLCLADVLLGLLLWRSYRGENTVSRASLEDAAALLADADVRLDPAVVPTAVVREHVYRVPVSDDAYRSAFASMVASTVTSAYLLPVSSGVSLLFENGDSVEYYHNLYLTYTGNGEDRAYLQTLTDAYLADERSVLPIGASAAEEDCEAASQFLSRLTQGEGAGARLRPRLREVYEIPGDPGLHLLVFCEEIVYRSSRRSAADINDTQMAVFVRDGVVLYLSGTWVPFLPDETYSIKSLDQLNILFSERKRHLVMQDEGRTQGLGHAVQHTDDGCEIGGMQRLYYMLWDDAGTLYLRPSWSLDYRLYRDDDTEILRTVLCDGVTGNVVRQEESAILPSSADVGTP